MASSRLEPTEVVGKQGPGVYYNLPASASCEKPECLPADAAALTTLLPASFTSVNDHSAPLQPICRENITASRQGFSKKASPSKLPVLKHKTGPVPSKRTSLSRVLKIRNKEKDEVLPNNCATESDQLSKNSVDVLNQAIFVNNVHSNSREIPSESKPAKKKSSSTSSLFGSWLRKKGKESNSTTDLKPTLLPSAVETPETCTRDNSSLDCNEHLDPNLRSTETLCAPQRASFTLSPRAVSGISWKFDDLPPADIAANLEENYRASNEDPHRSSKCLNLSPSSDTMSRASSVDIYSNQIDMNLTNSILESFSDNLSIASDGTMVGQNSHVSDDRIKCIASSKVEYCNLAWMTSSVHEEDQSDVRVVENLFHGCPDNTSCLRPEAGVNLFNCASGTSTEAKNLRVTSAHNMGYPLVVNASDDFSSSSKPNLGLIANGVSVPHCWLHLLSPTELSEPADQEREIKLGTRVQEKVDQIMNGNGDGRMSCENLIENDYNSTRISEVGQDKSHQSDQCSENKMPMNRLVAAFQNENSSIVYHFIKDETNAGSGVEPLSDSNVISQEVTIAGIKESISKLATRPNADITNINIESQIDFGREQLSTSNSMRNAVVYEVKDIVVKPLSSDRREILVNAPLDVPRPADSSNRVTLIPDSTTAECTSEMSNDPSSSHLAGCSVTSSNDIHQQNFTANATDCELKTSASYDESTAFSLANVAANVPRSSGQSASGTHLGDSVRTNGLHKAVADVDTTDTDDDELERAICSQTASSVRPAESQSSSPADIYSQSYTARASFVKPKIVNYQRPSVPTENMSSGVNPTGFSNDLYVLCANDGSMPVLRCDNTQSPTQLPRTFTYRDLAGQHLDSAMNERYPRLVSRDGAQLAMPQPAEFEPGEFSSLLLPRLFTLDSESGVSDRDRKIIRNMRTNLADWQKKSEWLSKKKRMKTFKKMGGACSEVVILHASDGAPWARYLASLLTSALTYRLGDDACTGGASGGSACTGGASGGSACTGGASGPQTGFTWVPVAGSCRQKIHHRPSVECRNVERILGPSVPPILAQRLHSARVQIVVMTPGFLSHVNDPQLELGCVLVPRRILGLLVGTSCDHVNDRHLGALISFQEWPLLTVAQPSVWLCAAVVSRALSVLCSSRVYSGYSEEPSRGAFRISPSKVTESQRQVYLLVEDSDSGAGQGELVSLEGVARDDVVIHVMLEGVTATRVHNWKYHNPYCVSFRMPDEAMRTSRLVEVTLALPGATLGARKIKCESRQDTIAALLLTLSDGADVMSQSLGVAPRSLDAHLASCLRRGLPPFTGAPLAAHLPPPSRLSCSSAQPPPGDCRSPSHLPTWLHFAAHHGLLELTAALLTVPGWREAVRLPNCDGLTPDRLAQANAHDNLAERLEYLALLVTDESLADFEAPPNLSELSNCSATRADCLHSPRAEGFTRSSTGCSTGIADCLQSPRSKDITRTSSTGSNRSHDLSCNAASPRRSRFTCSPSLLCASHPKKCLDLAVNSTTISVCASATPISEVTTCVDGSKEHKIGCHVKQVQGHQVLRRSPSSDGAHESTGVFESKTTARSEAAATYGTGERALKNAAVNNSDRETCAKSRKELPLHRTIGANYDTVSLPRPVLHAGLFEESMQSVTLGGPRARPVVFRRQRSDESNSRETKTKPLDGVRSKSIDCNLDEDSNARAPSPTNSSNNSQLPSLSGSSVSAKVTTQESVTNISVCSDASIVPRISSTHEDRFNYENSPAALPSYRSPHDSLPPLPTEELLESNLESPNHLGPDSDGHTSSTPCASRWCCDPSFSSVNGSALNDNQLLWTPRSQVTDSQDSSYLDMTRSDGSTFNSSLNMMHQSRAISSAANLTLEELRTVGRSYPTTFPESARTHSDSELHESYMESSSFVLPSEILESIAMTRSVTMPTYSTCMDKSNFPNGNALPSAVSSPNPITPIIGPSSRISTLATNTETVPTRDSAVSLNITRDISPSPAGTTTPSLTTFLGSSIASGGSSTRTHERLRFPVTSGSNNVERYDIRNHGAASNGSLPNGASGNIADEVQVSSSDRVSSPRRHVTAPHSRIMTPDSVSSQPELIQANGVQDAVILRGGSSQNNGVAARLKGFFKARSKHRLGEARRQNSGHASHDAAGDPHNDYVDDPTAAVPRLPPATEALATNLTSDEPVLVTSSSAADTRGSVVAHRSTDSLASSSTTQASSATTIGTSFQSTSTTSSCPRQPARASTASENHSNQDTHNGYFSKNVCRDPNNGIICSTFEDIVVNDHPHRQFVDSLLNSGDFELDDESARGDPADASRLSPDAPPGEQTHHHDRVC
ncbi:uncharacterized protein LOC108674844 [Hyalella azteca]|uniref:Uncharacterized protein LOC108674844 n=1 Tax=Hyalella azteca TaxID=294128 RepID=A0A979FNK3_HYAAZ|nr:uncharacterized protein LOC108674844 [Hyalella azteca]